MRAFFLAMLIYPEVQARAAAEVQEVVGSDRLPTLADRASLPYCSAVLKELFRWAVVGPLGELESCNQRQSDELKPLTGVPHVNKSQDDVYEGVFIPKGTIVIANIWFVPSHSRYGHPIHPIFRAITRDPKTYTNPHIFDPLRFLDRKEPETKANFGYGRRYCPGVGLAEASMFLQISQMLAVFKLERTRDTNGHEIIPPAIWETGTIRFVSSQSSQLVLTVSSLQSSPGLCLQNSSPINCSPRINSMRLKTPQNLPQLPSSTLLAKIVPIPNVT